MTDSPLRFYNTTYTIFAASVILVYINQEASEVEMQPLLRLVSMAIEVLETMSDDCVVAGRSAKLLAKALERAATARHQKDSERLAGTLMSMSASSSLQQHQQTQHAQQQHQQQHVITAPNDTHSGGNMGGAAALTPAESDHGGGAMGGGVNTVGPWPDPTMGINWMHCWAPVNLLDNDMLDFDLNMPYMGFESADHMGQRPG